jgi:hypothetical protein
MKDLHLTMEKKLHILALWKKIKFFLFIYLEITDQDEFLFGDGMNGKLVVLALLFMNPMLNSNDYEFVYFSTWEHFKELKISLIKPLEVKSYILKFSWKDL